jgi:hypothetical protein
VTVRELIDALVAAVERDATVATLEVKAEGCDCDGEAMDAYVRSWEYEGERRRDLIVARRERSFDPSAEPP